jgi:hypothetical protein
MRMIIPALAVLGLMATGGCANQKTYVTALNVCSSGNGTVKTAEVTKSSGSAFYDSEALKIAKAGVYAESAQLDCKPMTVEHKDYGNKSFSDS